MNQMPLLVTQEGTRRGVLFFVSVLSLSGTRKQLGFHTCQSVKRRPTELSPAPLLFVDIEIRYY